MKIKQTKKILITAAIGLVGIVAVVSTPAYADCGGVKTSVVDCTGTGTCAGGENPFEGVEPTDGASQNAYFTKYKHNYGKCLGDVDPQNNVENTGVWALLLMAINILTAGIGILAVAGIVYGSVLYASAGGSPEQVKKAMGIISNVVIGIVAYALMYALLNFLIPGGLFD